MKVVINRVAALFLILLTVWFIGFNAIRFVSKPYKTEIAVQHTAVDSINVKGLAFRDEQVITHDYSGVPRYLYTDASMVGKGTTVMEVYPSERDIRNIDKIENLQRQKNEYEKLSNIKFTSITSTDLLTKEIDKQIFDVLASCDSRVMADIASQKLELTMLMNKKDIYTGKTADYAAKIEKLENTISSLESSTQQPTDAIVTEVPGFFVKYTDGFESMLNTSLVKGMTDEQFKEYISATPQKLGEDVIGKTIENHNWYFSFMVSKPNMEKFKSSLKVDVNFHLSSIETIPADIVSITESEEKDTYLITLKMNYINDEIASLRVENAQVEFRFYSGLRVSRDAIRFLDNQRGVYVVGTSSIRFIPVNIIYEDKSFAVVTSADEKNALRIYDKVVVGGNVYDGKPI